MGFKSTCFFGVLATALLLSGCSRESSIRENVTLRNNHSVVFASTHPFQNPEAFADSVTNLANPDSVLVPDTLTVTINDTIYMMGFLKHYSERIGKYFWLLDSLSKDSSGKFTQKQISKTSKNGTPISWVYPKAGVYSPLFVAIDMNNATDTAGADQFIRVIDTPPFLAVPKDTLWTKYKTAITFPIVVRDSFGIIKDIRVDMDANQKKAKAKTWKYQKIEDTDSLLLTIPFDSNFVDSIGNQMIYVSTIDDDDNETIDSVHIHFNQLPKLELQSPPDSSRQNKNARFAFYYQAKDIDNPAAIRYFIRAAKTRDNSGAAPVLNDGDIIASNLQETSFEIITPEPVNLLVEKNGTLYMSKDGKLNEEAGERPAEGRIYWDVWVSDGYDTVYADKILDNGKTRPRYFVLTNPGVTTGTFKGVFKFDGLSDSSYADVSIVFKDADGNSFDAQVNGNGYFEAQVPPGTYTMTVTDLIAGRGYPDYQQKGLFIEVDDSRDLGKIILKDTDKPSIHLTNKIDTLTTRNDTLVGKFIDKGSQVKSASAWLDNVAQEFSSFSYAKWSVDLADLADGKHLFKMIAQDSAGNVSDTAALEFFVQATKLSLSINGKTTFMGKDSLRFQAVVTDAKPEVTSLTWKLDVEGAKTVSTKVTNNKSSLVLDETSLKEQFKVTLAKGELYKMYVESPQGTISNTVRFGLLGDGPMVYFETPRNDTNITINDVISPSLVVYANNSDETETYELTWNCDGALSCPTINELTNAISWKNIGDYKLKASIKNKDGKIAKDSISVHVIADPPSVAIQADEDTIRAKINTSYKIPINATDKYGTITAIAATCSGKSSETQNFAISPFSPLKNIRDSILISLPKNEDRNYKCIIKATDDDGEIGYDTLFFVVVLDPPHVSLNIKSQTLTIRDQVSLKYSAVDSIGYIAKYEYGCHRKRDSIQHVLKSFSGLAPSVAMPKDSGMYYCAIKVTDDDGLTASDTADYHVLLDPPTVIVQGPYTVTIKDQLSLDAIANDGLGTIAKYEWGCGSANSDNVGFTHFSTNTPQYTATMPNKPEEDYICIIRVTDDDGNYAMDTTHIEVVLAPPTVVVTNETAIIRQGYNIILNADAYDYPNFPGEIIKREWSCGENSDVINSNWRTVSSFDTVWSAPSAVAKLYCVARATDDDGNIAQDTTVCSYSTDIPLITVRDKSIYAVPGDVIALGADTNSVWQGINWFNWQCFDSESKKALETFTKLDYKSNYNQVVALNKNSGANIPYFYATRDLDFESKNMYCVISAEEASTKAIFYDTTFVNVISLSQKPVGVLSMADTIYPRSGNIAQTGEALYFYNDGWGGYNSINGIIGDDSKREYRWKFGSLGDGEYYPGKTNGHIDTSIVQFNDAFKRPTMETSFEVCLDFRDSAKTGANTAFMSRHQADEVCKTVYVRKAWKNLAAPGDTVLEYNNETPISPATTVVGTTPITVYAIGTNALHSKFYNGSEWKDLASPSISGAIKEIKIASNGSSAYLAVLTDENKLSIYQSTSGTSAWATYGTTIDKVSAMNITCKASSAPVISYIKESKPYFSYLNGTAWTTVKISNNGSQEVNAVYANSLLVFIYIKNTEDYTAYYAIYNSSFAPKVVDKNIGNDIKNVSLASDDKTIYMAFMNQDIVNTKTGPYIYKGEVSETELKWVNGTGYNTSVQLGTLAYNISVAVNNGKVLFAFDDNYYSYAQSHVYYHDGTGWSPYGETDLPYFYSQFINTHGYYLRGFAPALSISSDGKTYLSMLAWENAGGSGKNFGPIVMKYVADNWTVKDFKN